MARHIIVRSATVLYVFRKLLSRCSRRLRTLNRPTIQCGALRIHDPAKLSVLVFSRALVYRKAPLGGARGSSREISTQLIHERRCCWIKVVGVSGKTTTRRSGLVFCSASLAGMEKQRRVGVRLEGPRCCGTRHRRFSGFLRLKKDAPIPITAVMIFFAPKGE